MSAERRGWVIRTGTIKGQLETGGARSFWRRAAALRDGTSRVMGDCQARLCEGFGEKFPGPTWRNLQNSVLASLEILMAQPKFTLYKYIKLADGSWRYSTKSSTICGRFNAGHDTLFRFSYGGWCEDFSQNFDFVCRDSVRAGCPIRVRHGAASRAEYLRWAQVASRWAVPGRPCNYSCWRSISAEHLLLRRSGRWRLENHGWR